MADTRVYAPMVSEESGGYFHRLAVGVERTIRGRHHGRTFSGGIVGQHIDGSSECTGAIGGSSCATLYLDVVE